MWSEFLWLAAVAISAVACALVAPAATPIDRALPVAGAVVALVAALVRDTRWAPAILCGVPLLVGCAIGFPAETVRLLAYGVVVAVAFCGALLAAGELTFPAAAGFVVCGVALLRWLARSRVEISREAVILAGAIAIVAVTRRRSALTVAIALLAALLVPAIPARTIFIPLAVAGVGAAVRLLVTRAEASHPELERGTWGQGWRADPPTRSLATLGMTREDLTSSSLAHRAVPRLRLTFAPLVVIALMLTLFAWSGAVARAFPYFLVAGEAKPRWTVANALAPGETATYFVPDRAHALVVSLANGLEMKRGTVVATVDGRAVRAGDVADWGAARREVWWRARVVRPADPAGVLSGYGYEAWVDGAGRIPIGPNREITVAADPRLPRDVRVQVEAFEE